MRSPCRQRRYSAAVGLDKSGASAEDFFTMIPQNALDVVSRVLFHPVFLSAFSSWFIAQILKSCIALFRNRPQTAKEILMNIFWATGGMPSSHSAVVTALTTSVGFIEGADSTLFFVTFFYAMLTFRDALGVRRAAGHQAKALNHIIRHLSRTSQFRLKKLKEINGHSISEVFVGGLLGFFIAVAFCNL
jgi:acid phosphatase family membrane protein YuiD